jgi:hypothetical protein
VSAPRVRVVSAGEPGAFERDVADLLAAMPRAEVLIEHSAVYSETGGYGERYVALLVERAEPAVRHVVDRPHEALPEHGDPAIATDARRRRAP